MDTVTWSRRTCKPYTNQLHNDAGCLEEDLPALMVDRNEWRARARTNRDINSAVIKAKGRILKRVFQENKARQIFRKTNISYPLIRTRTGGEKCLFFGKFHELCFLETPVLRFALSPYYRRTQPNDG